MHSEDRVVLILDIEYMLLKRFDNWFHSKSSFVFPIARVFVVNIFLKLVDHSIANRCNTIKVSSAAQHLKTETGAVFCQC